MLCGDGGVAKFAPSRIHFRVSPVEEFTGGATDWTAGVDLGSVLDLERELRRDFCEPARDRIFNKYC